MWIRTFTEQVLYRCGGCGYLSEYIAPLSCPQCRTESIKWQITAGSVQKAESQSTKGILSKVKHKSETESDSSKY